jgi:hypothetical protein
MFPTPPPPNKSVSRLPPFHPCFYSSTIPYVFSDFKEVTVHSPAASFQHQNPWNGKESTCNWNVCHFGRKAMSGWNLRVCFWNTDTSPPQATHSTALRWSYCTQLHRKISWNLLTSKPAEQFDSKNKTGYSHPGNFIFSVVHVVLRLCWFSSWLTKVEEKCSWASYNGVWGTEIGA